MAVDMATQEVAPKRHRRTNAEITAARAAGVEPQPRERAPRGKGGKVNIGRIRGLIGGAVTVVDKLLVTFAPVIWAPEDSLNPGEINLLSAAVADEVARYPKAVGWFERATQANEHAKLAYAVAIITAPRLARRGLIPGELANGLVAGVLAAGAAPSDNRADGNGENNPG